MVGTPEGHSPERDARVSPQAEARTPRPQRVKPQRAPRPKLALPRLRRQKGNDTSAPATRKSSFSRSPVGRALKAVIRITQLALLAYLAFYLYFAVSASRMLHKADATPSQHIAGTRGTNWLLVGSDSRDGLTAHERAQMHTGVDLGSQRTDVIIIVHFDGLGNPTLISIPRDSYVTIPEHMDSNGELIPAKHNKINASFVFGGAPLLVSTVETNTGLHIDHYMQIGFAGIRDITNAVGGVDICVPRKYTDSHSGLKVKKGCQTMNGTTALAYVRMRYADPTGDIGRIQRQQQYLAAVIHRVSQPANFLNPFRMIHLARAGAAAVLVGTDDNALDVLKLAWAMRDLSHGNGKVQTVPVSDPNATTPVGSSVLWDKGAAHEVFVNLGAR
jgi:LCP family protein required for cell wall assembly